MKLIMNLRSDAMPGAGEGLAGIIDTDIAHDECGIPYIPAKRIKGILRESAIELQDAGELSKDQVFTLFGKTGCKKGTTLRIANGYIANYDKVRNFLRYCSQNGKIQGYFNSEAALSFYTYTRSQTTIEEESGTAKKSSLRTFRVLKKGLTFEFDVQGAEGSISELKKICAVTKHFGLSRTRGLGEISMSLDTSSPSHQPIQVESEMSDDIQEHDVCQLELTIRNIGPILAVIRVGQEQTSESYIPGSLILGAFAEKFKQDLAQLPKGKVCDDETFRAIFLDGDITFGNAYPVKNTEGERYAPTPVSIVKQKDQDTYFDLVQKDIRDLIEGNIQTKGTIGEFSECRGDEIFSCSPTTKIEYHHARPEEKRWMGHAKERDGVFFQFSVLQPDQSFRASIRGQYRYLKRLQALLEEDNIFSFGRSKTAQYGKSLVSGTLEKMEEDAHHLSWSPGDELVITLESNVMIRNANGFFDTDPACFLKEFIQWLRSQNSDLAEEKIVLEKSFLKTSQIGGFVGIWGLPKMQIPALAAGSVLVCRNTSDQTLHIGDAAQHAFGERIEEGYGKIKLNWHGKHKEVVPENEKEEPLELEQDSGFMTDFVRHILEERVNAALKALAEQSLENIGQINNSFLGKMLLLLKDSDSFTNLETEKFSHLRDRARKHLEKLGKALYLDFNGQQIKIKQDEFTAIVQQLPELQNIREELPNVLEAVGLSTEGFYQTRIFKCYQQYALHLLTLLKFRNRKEGNS